MRSTTKDDAMIKAHKLHLGLYRRVADKLGVSASYVSRVVAGERKGPNIRQALLDELRKIQRLR
jgi:transcriptional regulator with XRE-family HTH domain